MPLRAALPLALLVLASGCTPRLVHRLDAPDPSDGVWQEGVQMRTAATGPVEATVGYVRSDARDHALWVRITNRSDAEVVVDPADFAAVVFGSRERAEGRDPSGREAPARDPEVELVELELEAARDDASGRTAIVLGAVTGALTVAAAVADPPETDAEAYAVEDALYLAGDVVADGAEIRRAAEFGLVNGRAYWEVALRRTTLPPNTFIDGLVHVPIDPAGRWVVVEVRAAGAAVPFLFKQRTIRP